MKVMKAARLHKIGDFHTEEVPIPVPHGDELLVKVEACGVCGSDLPRIYQHGTSNQRYPLTLGHEFAGEIVAVGKNADPALIGRRGAFYPLIPCRHCDPCLSGNYAMCEDYDYMGSRRDGGFAEYCLVPSSWHFVESYNPNTSFQELAMLEPLCVAQHAIIHRSEMYAGANVVIFGAGPIGIMAARWAELAGAGHVLLVDVLDEKVAFAQERGFSAVNSTNTNLIESVRNAFSGQLADIAVEGTGFGSALNNAINIVKPFGRITLLGNPAGDTVILQSNHSALLRKEITFAGVWNSHFSNVPINEWRFAVDMLDAGKFKCADLISHECTLDELPQVIDGVKNKTINACKILYVSSKK